MVLILDGNSEKVRTCGVISVISSVYGKPQKRFFFSSPATKASPPPRAQGPQFFGKF